MDNIITILISEDVWTDEVPRPQPSVLMATNGTDNAYLTTNVEGWPVSMELVGSWDEYTGAPQSTITNAYTEWIRPLGNDDGVATGFLDSMRWAGHPEAKFFEYEQPDPELPPTVVERYPAANRPFTLKIERTFITDDGFPQIPHGWKVTMLSDDPLRDITARAIGIYNSSGGYLYTTGAFIDDGSGTYFTECPVGQRTADEADIYFKLLLGSAPEGAWDLLIGKEEDAREFWSADQGAAPAAQGATWGPSGHVVTGMSGTVTLTDSNASFTIGQTVRINGNEMTLTSTWTGVGLVLTPYQASANGSVIEILQ